MTARGMVTGQRIWTSGLSGAILHPSFWKWISPAGNESNRATCLINQLRFPSVTPRGVAVNARGGDCRFWVDRPYSQLDCP